MPGTVSTPDQLDLLSAPRHKPGIHYANPERSERAAKLLRLFEARGEAGVTTWEFQSVAGVCSGSTVASELRTYLRAIGSSMEISPATYEGRTPQGMKIYRYFLRARV